LIFGALNINNNAILLPSLAPRLLNSYQATLVEFSAGEVGKLIYNGIEYSPQDFITVLNARINEITNFEIEKQRSTEEILRRMSLFRSPRAVGGLLGIVLSI